MHHSIDRIAHTTALFLPVVGLPGITSPFKTNAWCVWYRNYVIIIINIFIVITQHKTNYPTDRITHTTASVTPVMERKIAQWVHHEGSIQRPIAPWANALTTELHLTPQNVLNALLNKVISSFLFTHNPLSYFLIQPVLHDWCNKGHGMCYPVCGMVHIKEPLLLIDKNGLTPYNHR